MDDTYVFLVSNVTQLVSLICTTVRIQCGPVLSKVEYLVVGILSVTRTDGLVNPSVSNVDVDVHVIAIVT